MNRDNLKTLVIVVLIASAGIVVSVGLHYWLSNPGNDVQLGSVVDSNPIATSPVGAADFQIDQVYHSDGYGDIHYSVYIPTDYDASKSYPMYITLPGYEGLYFQGVGVNLRDEDFASEAVKINQQMIVVAPQLSDWGETSANQTIALIEYFKDNYNVNKVYANDHSGGGETMSLVMGKRADLIDAYLQVSSQWDGTFESTVENEVPVYFFVGESDEYYGSEPTIRAYNTLHDMYVAKGLSEERINEILILDVRGQDFFDEHGMPSQHGGGGLVAHEENIMRWLLSR